MARRRGDDVFALDAAAPKFAGPKLIGFEGIADAAAVSFEDDETRAARREADERTPHYTYVMRAIDRAGGPDRIKVGFTKSPNARGRQHGTLGFDLELISLTQHEGRSAARRAEVALIRLYADDPNLEQVAPETFVAGRR